MIVINTHRIPSLSLSVSLSVSVCLCLSVCLSLCFGPIQCAKHFVLSHLTFCLRVGFVAEYLCTVRKQSQRDG